MHADSTLWSEHTPTGEWGEHEEKEFFQSELEIKDQYLPT